MRVRELGVLGYLRDMRRDGCSWPRVASRTTRHAYVLAVTPLVRAVVRLAPDEAVEALFGSVLFEDKPPLLTVRPSIMFPDAAVVSRAGSKRNLTAHLTTPDSADRLQGDGAERERWERARRLRLLREGRDEVKGGSR
jgi:hypothetical protein